MRWLSATKLVFRGKQGVRKQPPGMPGASAEMPEGTDTDGCHGTWVPLTGEAACARWGGEA